MFVDNTVSMSRWMLAEVLTLVLGIAFMIYSAFDSSIIWVVLGILSLVAFVVMLFINPSYFYFNDEIAGKDLIEIRSVQAFPFFRKYQQYGIMKKTIQSYEIKSDLFGLRKMISIKIKGVSPTAKKLVIEKTISANISILKKEKIKELETVLQKYLKK